MTIDKIVNMTKEIEGKLILLGASGRGLHTKLDSLSTTISTKIQKSIRFIATIRNKVLHEPDFELDVNVFNQFSEKFNEANNYLDSIISSKTVKNNNNKFIDSEDKDRNNSISKDYLQSFKGLTIDGDINVSYTQNRYKNYINTFNKSEVSTYINCGMLYINGLGKNTYKINCSSIELNEIKNLGLGDIFIESLSTSTFKIQNLSPGDITINDLNSTHLHIQSSGPGDVIINNLTSTHLRIQSSGPGDVIINGKSELLEITLSGSGDVIINGNSGLTAINLNGSGDIILQGKSNVDNVKNDGSGEIILNGNIICSTLKQNTQNYQEQSEYTMRNWKGKYF